MVTARVRLAIAGPNGRMGQELINCLASGSNIKMQLGGLLFRDTLKMQHYQTEHPQLAMLCHTDLDALNDNFDTLIDFTSPQATQAHLAFCQAQGKAMIIGTTGLNSLEYQQIELASQIIPIVYSANFSVGVNVMLNLLKHATRVLAERSDIEIIEAHHRNKVDAPSGTALAMGKSIASTLGVELEDVACYSRYGNSAPRGVGQIGFSTIRGGDIIGEHSALFLAEGERITISHAASQRNIFAQGAIRAATWLADKKAGLYSMDDVLGLDAT